MDGKPETPTPKRASWFQIEHLHHWRDDGPPARHGFGSMPVTIRPQNSIVTLWALFLISLASWPLLYLPFFLFREGFESGFSGGIFVMFIWGPGLVLMNIGILLIVVTVIMNCRPRQVSGRMAATLAVIHPIIFVARIISALCMR
jgi:hypothetical protein